MELETRKVERIRFQAEPDEDGRTYTRFCWKFDLSDHFDYYEFGDGGESFAIPKPPPQVSVRPVVMAPGPQPGPGRN